MFRGHGGFKNYASQLTTRLGATETHQTFNGTSWTINNTFYFIWEDGRIVQRRDGGTSAYICTNYYPEGEIRCYAGTTSKYYHTHDHLGSVYELTSTAGAVQAAYSFTPCGERSKRWGGAATDIAYTGHWNLKPSFASHPAASELSLTWFRAYDPKRGVWLNRDPISEHGGLNLYSMCHQNTISRRDASGLVDHERVRYAEALKSNCCDPLEVEKMQKILGETYRIFSLTADLEVGGLNREIHRAFEINPMPARWRQSRDDFSKAQPICRWHVRWRLWSRRCAKTCSRDLCRQQLQAPKDPDVAEPMCRIHSLLLTTDFRPPTAELLTECVTRVGLWVRKRV